MQIFNRFRRVKEKEEATHYVHWHECQNCGGLNFLEIPLGVLVSVYRAENMGMLCKRCKCPMF